MHSQLYVWWRRSFPCNASWPKQSFDTGIAHQYATGRIIRYGTRQRKKEGSILGEFGELQDAGNKKWICIEL